MITKEKLDDRLQRVRDLIASDLTLHYTIRELARYSNLNEVQLKSGFREKYGCGVFKYRTGLMMEQAKKWIDLGWELSDVAERLGYSYLTNFVAAFRRHCGMTPGTYKHNSQIG